MGVDIAVSQAGLMSGLLKEEATLGDLVTLLKLREGEAALVEKPLMAGSKPVGVQVRALGLPEDAVCVAVLRGGRVLFPRADLTLKAEDRMIVLTTVEEEQRVAEALGLPATCRYWEGRRGLVLP